jgi:hypothetical protein
MRATSAVAAVCFTLVLVACGSNPAEKHARGPAQQVADTVTALEHDLLTRNYADVCEQVLSSDARVQAGNDTCPDFVRRGAAHLHGERIRIRSITVRGGAASAEVTTTARGQAPVRDTIRLVFENGRYRVNALAGSANGQRSTVNGQRSTSPARA